MKSEFRKNMKMTTHQPAKWSVYEKHIKRPMDFILSLIGIIILSPVLLTVAILIRIKLGRPIIFKQKRPGLNEKIFTMYKFRTMTDAKDMNGNLLSDSVRLTRFGKSLRATSLDELPELWNIVRGDMALVGPRPQLVRDMVFMTPEQRLRHTVLPGLTGWAQVNGRNKATWEQKLSLDLEYIKDISFINDWKIIVMTVAKVFMKEDISTEGMDTAEDLGDYLLRVGKVDREEYAERLEKSINLIN